MIHRHSPSPLIFKRVIAYARQSFQVVRELVENPFFVPEAKWKSIFVTPLQPYDVLIYLADSKGSKKKKKKTTKTTKGRQTAPIYVGLDLVENYLSELRERFGHLALFFYNALQEQVIGVVWKPGIFKPKPFKVANAQHAIPIDLLPDHPLVKVRTPTKTYTT